MIIELDRHRTYEVVDMAGTNPSVADLARLLKVIADETRLRILGAIAEEPLTGKDLAERLGLTPPTISHHMRKLSEAGIVVAESDAQRQWYRVNTDLLNASRRVSIAEHGAVPTRDPDAADEEGRFRAKVLRDFFVDERLKEIPAQRKRRVIVLQYLLERFEPERDYSEREVNDLLRPAHADVATLRREIVDYGFMDRERGTYRVARRAPPRRPNVAQEITGDERGWLRSLLERATAIEPENRHSG
jgi:DNA-binding HxlR family transcriptional regulator